MHKPLHKLSSPDAVVLNGQRPLLRFIAARCSIYTELLNKLVVTVQGRLTDSLDPDSPRSDQRNSQQQQQVSWEVQKQHLATGGPPGCYGPA
jgi:hypothetical protein